MKLNLKESVADILLIILVISWIILAIIFGFTDLEISKAVVNESSLWGNFGAEYGEVPGYALITIALSVLIGGYNPDLRKQKIPAYIIILIGILLFISGFIFGSEDLILDGGGIAISLIIFVILTYNKDWENYRKISAVITILTILNPLLFVQITKALTGRVRFRDLLSDFSDYTPWFLPPGPSGNQSFPSGHTSMSFMFIPLLILVRDRKKGDPVRIIVSFLVVGWSLFVGLSRIAVGAHYASDVLFAGGMATLITIFLYKLIYIKRGKGNKEKSEV